MKHGVELTRSARSIVGLVDSLVIHTEEYDLLDGIELASVISLPTVGRSASKSTANTIHVMSRVVIVGNQFIAEILRVHAVLAGVGAYVGHSGSLCCLWTRKRRHPPSGIEDHVAFPVNQKRPAIMKRHDGDSA